ncbi:MAG: acyl-CoA thioesterase [Ignavibacteriae bacterium HGW-Ignavibacteriae-2]|jgi:acyl-CoA thioester hydrolase|nr:MAG: acyl-CoA thioesterase [Ignavibacteriae bacterium HGW-Ignavibacteriae-2]
MVKSTTLIRVRYAETDKMQFVYNGKYFEYFEVGRAELLRDYGLSYYEVENRGYQLPLIEAGIKYKSPAFYDDILEVEAKLLELNSPKLHIEYAIKRQSDGQLIAEGFTDHVFINIETKKAVRPPKFYLDTLAIHFKE